MAASSLAALQKHQIPCKFAHDLTQRADTLLIYTIQNADLIMRQVPHYLLIGSGRVARHFQYYLSLLQIPFQVWHRQDSLAQLQQKLVPASHILVLINDAAIDEFIQKYIITPNKIVTHFSGSLVSSLAYGAHPLMTFNDDLYSFEQYQSIPFVIDEDAPTFEMILPGLPNQHVRLPKSLKAKYHALCVLSGNFSCLLWQKFFSTLEQEFHFPIEIMTPYLLQQTQNIVNNYKTALTGPLVRNDLTTIHKNIDSLENDPFQEIYKSFVASYTKQKTEGTV